MTQAILDGPRVSRDGKSQGGTDRPRPRTGSVPAEKEDSGRRTEGAPVFSMSGASGGR
jgi:hypothetical protein